MDDDFAKFEAQLRDLRPVAPSPRLSEAIGEALTAREAARAEAVPAAERRLRPMWWVAAATLPIAAGLTVAIVLFSSRGKPPAPAPMASPADMMKPVAVKDVLYASADEGVVTLDDGTPARKQRLQYVGTVKWRDPKTNASLTWTVPREEIRFVPVRYQ